jgi:hypothetical protein
LSVLIDPTIPLDQLIALRQIAECLRSGMLKAQEAETAVCNISPKFTGCFHDAATAAAVIEAIEAIMVARSSAARRLSRSERFRLKAVECLQLADISNLQKTKETYRSLALCYEQLATHAEAIEKHNYEKLRTHSSRPL